MYGIKNDKLSFMLLCFLNNIKSIELFKKLVWFL